MDAAEKHEARKAELDTRRQNYWEEAELMEMQPEYQAPVLKADEWGVLDVVEHPSCPFGDRKGPAWPWEECSRTAGYYTDHEGTGACYRHGGNFGRERAKGAILMAMAYADEMNVSPWEAMMSQIRLLANQVAWLRIRVYEAEEKYGAAGLRPGGEGWDWVAMLEARGERLAKVAKMAVDAGIAATLIRQAELEGENMMKAAIAGMDAAGVQGEAREKLLDVMSRTIVELETNLNVQLTSS